MSQLKKVPHAIFESIVTAVIVEPETGALLTVEMRPKANNQLAGERHFPGGGVEHGECPQVAIRLRLQEKLGVIFEEVRPFYLSVREGILKINEAPQDYGVRYVTTFWFIAALPSGVTADLVEIADDCDLVPGSNRWAGFHQLIDNRYPDRLGEMALTRSPLHRLQLALSLQYAN